MENSIASATIQNVHNYIISYHHMFKKIIYICIYIYIGIHFIIINRPEMFGHFPFPVELIPLRPFESDSPNPIPIAPATARDVRSWRIFLMNTLRCYIEASKMWYCRSIQKSAFNNQSIRLNASIFTGFELFNPLRGHHQWQRDEPNAKL